MLLQCFVIRDLRRKLQKVITFPWRYKKKPLQVPALHSGVGPPAVQHQLTDGLGV